MTEPIRTVLFVVAMQAEAAPIIDKLELKKDDPQPIKTPTACQTYSGTVRDLSVHLVHNGKSEKHGVDKVGTNAACLTTYLAINAIRPDLVISAGTAGGFRRQGADIGSIFLSTAIINHDRRIPLPGFESFALGREEPHSAAAMAKALGFKEGVVSTGNSLDFTEQCMAIMTEHSAAVKEMEAAAVAYVCRIWSTPMVAIKAVTDIVDGDKPAAEEFIQNLHTASQALQTAVCDVVDFLQGKTLADL